MLNRDKSQLAISHQVLAYLRLLSDKLHSLNEQEAAAYPVLKNLPPNFLATLEYINQLEEGGFCHGLSVCRAAMRLTGQLAWWEAVIDLISTWDGTFESLQKEVTLPNANNPVVLHDIFERFIHAIVFNQASHISMLQRNLLLPGGPFVILDNSNQKFEIKYNYKIGGHFSSQNLIEILEPKTVKHAIQKNICLVHNPIHACELSYENDQWYFFDPRYENGRAQSFSSLKECVDEMIRRLGDDIYIELACIENIENTPFTIYEEYLKNPEIAKEILLGNQGKSLFIFAMSTPHLLPALFKLIDLQPHEVSTLINNTYTSKFLSVLSAAVIRGSNEAVLLLLNNGANPNITDCGALTPLMYGAMFGFNECINTLIKRGAFIDLQNIQGETALIIAIKNWNIDCVSTLLFYGANLNIQGNDGWTPLLLAVNNNDIDCIDIMLSLGKNICVANYNTALKIAVDNGQTKIAQRLIKKMNEQHCLETLVLEKLQSIADQKQYLDILTLINDQIELRNTVKTPSILPTVTDALSRHEKKNMQRFMTSSTKTKRSDDDISEGASEGDGMSKKPRKF